MGMTFLGLTLGVLAVAGTLAAFARNERTPWWNRRPVFILLLAGMLLVFQRDALRANFQLWNPDESQLIAGALTLSERSVFWRDVDGTTHGPLDQWPLVLPAMFGARLDYTSSRVVAAGLTILLLACLQAALAHRLSEGTSRLLVLPAWALFAFNQDPETAQYCTELMPSLLLALAVALLPRAAGAQGCVLIGLAAGAAPFAKLQAAPLAAWVLLLAAIGLVRATDRWRKLGALALGAATPALCFGGFAAASGAWADFRVRYLETNLLGYAIGGEKFFNDARPTPDMLFGFSQFLWPASGAIVLGASWLAIRRIRVSASDLVLTTGLAAIAVFTILAPNKPFAHYFLLLVGPLVLLLGSTAGPAFETLVASLTPLRRQLAAGLLGVALCGGTVAHHFQHPDYFRFILRSRPPVSRELVEALQRRTTPGEGLAVWGWQPALYVMTQTVSATPDLIIFWQILPSRWRDFYQARYLRDLAARPPVVFVDTMGPTDFFFFRHPEATRHEAFPALAQFIRENYVLAETIKGARVYLRKDRIDRLPGKL